MIKDVDVLIDLQDLEFQEMQRASVNHVDHGSIQGVGPALEDLSDNFVSIWHFNNATKVWTFYDGGEGSTLTHVVTGETYLLEVKASVEVILNDKTRNLTCVAEGRGWNQIVW